MRLAHRLALGYGTVIGLLITVSLLMESRLSTLSDTTSEALQIQYPRTVLVHQITIQLGSIARSMRNALILVDHETQMRTVREIEAAQAEMLKLLQQLTAQSVDAQGQDVLRRMRIVHSAYAVNQDDFIRLLAQQRMGEARNLLIVDLNGYQEDYFKLLNEFSRLQSARMLEVNHLVEERQRATRHLVYLATGAAVLLSIWVTAVITRSVLRRLGGEPDYAALTARRIAAGDLQCRIDLRPDDERSLLHDMDEMRRTLIDREQSLQQANAELRQTVRQLSLAKDELVASEKLAALGALVAGVAHELNTPIGNGLLAASTVADGCHELRRLAEHGLTRKALNERLLEAEAAADLLQRNLSRAADLISSFKQVAVDRQSSQHRQFWLHEVVHEICLTLQALIRKTPYRLEIDVPADIQMLSYPGPLGQVLTNLIQNALLHGLEGRVSGQIRIEASRLDAQTLELRVRDDGAGIEPSHLPRVFEPFFTTRMGRGGTGLGLHVSFNIVTVLLGGKISLDSAPGQGTCVTLTLPTVVAERAEPESAGAVTAAPSHART